MRELRGRDEVEAWLAAGLCLRRLGSAAAPGTPLAEGAWISATLDELPALPPPGVIVDLGHLLGDDPGALARAAATPVPVSDARLRTAVRAYEDQVLARLAADPRWEAASFALARLDGRARARAIALVCGHLLERIGYPGGVAVSPALLRRALHQPAPELARLGLAALRQPGPLVERLADGYEQLVRAARGTRALLGDREIFALEHLTTLGSLARRVAAEQIVESAEALERGLPRRLRRRADRAGAIATRLDDESAYPIGGFAAVANAGSFENLVTSELMYMEPADEVDLFDLRYVEGELLYYTRDESIAVRRRHTLSFVLDATLEAARYKDPELAWQRLVLALGLVLCTVRRLVEWLAEEALELRVVFVRDAHGRAALAEERALVELLLSEWIERGLVSVGESADSAAALAEGAARARTGLADVVVVSLAAPEPDTRALPRHVGVASLRLDDAHPRLRWRGAAGADDPAGASGSPWQAWEACVLELVRGVV